MGGGRRAARGLSGPALLEVPALERRGVHGDRHIAGWVAVVRHQRMGGADLVEAEDPREAAVDLLVHDEVICLVRLVLRREVAALDPFLSHPDVARVEGDVVAGGAGAEDDHPAASDDVAGHGEGGLAGVFEDDVDVDIARDVPDGLAELADFLHPGAVGLGVLGVRHLPPAVEVLPVQPGLGAELHAVATLVFARHDRDRVGAGGLADLDGHRAEATRASPDKHVHRRLQDMRGVAVEHAPGGGMDEHVAARLGPGEVFRLREDLLGLHLAELGEGAVGRLVAPDLLAAAHHRVATVAVVALAAGLVAVDDDLIAHLAALHAAADGPDDARGVGAGDVVGLLVDVQRGQGLAERRPDTVVVDAGGHHVDEDLVRPDVGDGDHLVLERDLGGAVTLLADGHRDHRLRHLAEGWDLSEFKEFGSVTHRGLARVGESGQGRRAASPTPRTQTNASAGRWKQDF